MQFKTLAVAFLTSVALAAPVNRRDPQLGNLSGQLNNVLDLLQKQYQHALNNLQKGAAGSHSLFKAFSEDYLH